MLVFRLPLEPSPPGKLLMNDPLKLQSQPTPDQTAARRPYAAPQLVAFGTVEDFTRGGGSGATRDFQQTTRKTR